MKRSRDGARWRAAGAAVLILVAGAAMGVTVDRHWPSPPEAHRGPLTGEAMAARLGLSPAQAAHVQALLDSLHGEIHAAVEQGPDSLRSAAREAERRIEEALPPEARTEFRAWMEEQYQHMMGHARDRRHDEPVDHDRIHREGPDGAHAGDRAHRPR